MGLEIREAILGKTETTYNRDPGLTPAADGIWIDGPVSYALVDPVVIERNPVSPTIGAAQPVVAGWMKTISFKIRLKGSGSATTPPELAVILKAAGFLETIGGSNVAYSISSTATNHKSATFKYYEDGVVHKLTGAYVEKLEGNLEATGELDVTIYGHTAEWGTATAGAASSITLAADHTATDSIYNGQKIRILSGTGAGQTNTITAYTGTTKLATVGTPWTTVPDTTSVYAIDNGPIDGAIISPTYDSTVEPSVLGMPFRVGSYAAVINSLSFGLGILLAKRPAINTPNGKGTISIAGRDVSGSIEAELDTLANKDWENEWRNGTSATIDTGVIGGTTGNKYQIQLLRSRLKDAPSQGSREKVRTRKLNFTCDGRTADGEITITFS